MFMNFINMLPANLFQVVFWICLYLLFQYSKPFQFQSDYTKEKGKFYTVSSSFLFFLKLMQFFYFIQ
jgi:hypothetical protein